MSCEPADATPQKSRGLFGWLLVAVIFGLVAFYAHVVALLMNPHMDEVYRRTFLTGEFSVYPSTGAWKPGDGLDYSIGTYVDFSRPEMRKWLGRFDWRGDDAPTVTLRGISGRLYLHVVGENDIASRQHRLSLSLNCRILPHHAHEIEVLVNGRSVAIADCIAGAITIDAQLAPGQLGVNRYDEIAIMRDEGSLFERIMTRVGLRAQAVELVGLSVDAQ